MGSEYLCLTKLQNFYGLAKQGFTHPLFIIDGRSGQMLTRHRTKELRWLYVYSLPFSMKCYLLVPQGKRKLESRDMSFPNFHWELFLSSDHNPLPKFLSCLTAKAWGRAVVLAECSSTDTAHSHLSLKTFMFQRSNNIEMFLPTSQKGSWRRQSEKPTQM